MATVEPKFKETQQYRNWVFWVIITVIFLTPFIFRLYFILENGLWEAFRTGIIAHILSLGLIIFLFILMKTRTSIDNSGIEINDFPFAHKKFRWEEIKEIKIIDYNFEELRGKGINFWTHYGIVDKLKENRGLLINLKNAKNYLISTQKPEELKTTIDYYTAKTSL